MNEQAIDKSTPRPWCKTRSGPVMNGDYSQPFGIVQYSAANLIAGVFGDVQGGEETAKANAELIVRAVNSFEAMREALKGLYEHCSMIHNRWGDGCNQKEADAAIKAGREALALAEGKEVQS